MQQVKAMQDNEVAAVSILKEQASLEANLKEGLGDSVACLLDWAQDGDASMVDGNHVVQLDREAYIARLRCEKYSDMEAAMTENMDSYVSPLVRDAQVAAEARCAAGDQDTVQDTLSSGYTSGHTQGYT